MTKPNIERAVWTIIWFRGAPYIVSIGICRKALVRRQVEGELHNMTSLAVAASVSRSTASRFFSGKSVSLAACLRILKTLHLAFDDACQPATDEQVEEWRRQQDDIRKAEAEARKRKPASRR